MVLAKYRTQAVAMALGCDCIHGSGGNELEKQQRLQGSFVGIHVTSCSTFSPLELIQPKPHPRAFWGQSTYLGAGTRLITVLQNYSCMAESGKLPARIHTPMAPPCKATPKCLQWKRALWRQVSEFRWLGIWWGGGGLTKGPALRYTGIIILHS